MAKKIVKNILKTLRKGKRIVKKEMKLEDIEAMPEDIQKERGYQHGEIKAMQEELDDLREKIKRSKEKEDVARFLSQKEEEFRRKELSGTLSLRGLFDVLSGKFRKKNITLLNRNRTVSFGNLHDISFNSDGRIGLLVMEN